MTKTGLHPQEQQAAETTSGCLAGQILCGQVCDFRMWDNEISTAVEKKQTKENNLHHREYFSAACWPLWWTVRSVKQRWHTMMSGW